MDKVTKFLCDFRALKADAWEVLFKELGNAQLLASLEMRTEERNKLIEALNEEDYSEGPVVLSDGEAWIFGKMYKGKELCIKIMIGWYGEEVICISFHLSENKIIYPFKKLVV